MNFIDEFISKTKAFQKEMIDKFEVLMRKYSVPADFHATWQILGIVKTWKNGKLETIPGVGTNTVQVYLDFLKYGSTKNGWLRIPNGIGINNAIWPKSINEIPGLGGLAPKDLIQFFNSYEYALNHAGNYVTTGQRDAPIVFPKAYSLYVDFWNERYNDALSRIQKALTASKVKKEHFEKETHGTGITWAPGWGPKPKDLPADWQIQIQRMRNDIKHGAPDNMGSLLSILKEGHDPIWKKFTSGKYVGQEYPAEPTISSKKVTCTQEHPCYHFSTYNWHESQFVKYTKDWKGNWIITECPSFDKIEKIVLVWWNGDAAPVDTKFSFLTVYDKDRQTEEILESLRNPHIINNGWNYYYYGINPTIHLNLFGNTKAVIYTFLTDGKIIAYGPLTDDSNENAVSEYVSSIPTSRNPTVPSIFQIPAGNKIVGRPPKPKNLSGSSSSSTSPAKPSTTTQINPSSSSPSPSISTDTSQASQVEGAWFWILLGAIILFFTHVRK